MLRIPKLPRPPRRRAALPPGPQGTPGRDGVDGETPSNETINGLISTLLPKRYAKVHTTDASGDVTVTWPSGRFASAPVVNIAVLGDSGNAYTAHVVSVSSTTCVIKVRKFNALSFNLVGLVTLTLFANPGATSVHVRAEVASD